MFKFILQLMLFRLQQVSYVRLIFLEKAKNASFFHKYYKMKTKSRQLFINFIVFHYIFCKRKITAASMYVPFCLSHDLVYLLYLYPSLDIS